MRKAREPRGAPSPARAHSGAPGGRLPRLAAALQAGEVPFEGPLDLLLHLVKEHQVDLFDIPIARITESYLATLKAVEELDIDVAGGFLDMAAQLMLMKSKLLLPRTEVAEDAAAEEAAGSTRAPSWCGGCSSLPEVPGGRRGAGRAGHPGPDRLHAAGPGRAAGGAEGPEGLADVSVFKLIEALDRALKNAKPEVVHQVATDRLTITDAIARVVEVLRLQPAAPPSRSCCAARGAPHRSGGHLHLPGHPGDGQAQADPHLPGLLRRGGRGRGRDPRRGPGHARRRGTPVGSQEEYR